MHQQKICREFPAEPFVYPRLCVAPMGWSHALDLAHSFPGVACKSLDLEYEDLLQDVVRPCSIGEGIAAVYADSFMFFAGSREKVWKA